MITAIVTLSGIIAILITALCWCVVIIRRQNKELEMYTGELLPWDWEEE